MSYQETARAFAQTIAADSFAAAAKLPLSEWAESRRDIMSPQTIAHNHALHVESAAFELREALTRADQEGNPMMRLSILADVEDAGRALLAAIGEAS